MSQRQVKQARRLIRKQETEIIKSFMSEIKTASFFMRMKIAWQVIKGAKK